MQRPMLRSFLPVFLVLFGAALIASAGHASEINLSTIADATRWRVHNRIATVVGDDAGRKVAHLDAGSGDGIAWLAGSDFATGVIEIELRGRNQPGASFVGLAFHGVDDETFEAIYFRPFNFQQADAGRRIHSVQYISLPGHDWSELREKHPGVYESAIDPAPAPEAWLHARIEIDAELVRVFVNAAPAPCLVVQRIPDRASGRIGLWVGNGSGGDFARLTIMPSGP